ncbi:MAG: mechanosensitive ion channel family protein [Xanthomonadales bacterium]|nr:mechanosensitive ion channel family protein [Xanthomonadales bacterium]
MISDLERLGAMFDPATLKGAAALAAVLFGSGIALSWLVRRMLGEVLLHDRSERIDTITLTFLSRLAILVIWLLLAGFYAHLVPALNRIGTALLAGVSLVSVIVGFAAQATLGNLIAGISLVLYKPFRRGDRLQVSAPTKDEFDVGTVETISLGFTVLRTDDGRRVIIANGTMAQQTMIKLDPPSTTTTATAPVSGR